MKYRLLLYLLILSFSACSPKIIERVRVEKEYVSVERIDTTIIRDSIYIKEKSKGDTVIITEYRDRFKYQYKMLRDTIAKHDTTFVEAIKEVKVEQPLSWWKRAKLGAFWWILGALVAALVWIFRKPLLSLLKL